MRSEILRGRRAGMPWIWLLGLLFALPSLTSASDMRLGGLLPGGGVVHKKVVSMREQRFTHLVRQHTDFSCGAAALATILRYAYGRDVGEEQVLRAMLQGSDAEQVRRSGFSLLDIKRYVERLGLRGRGYQITAAALEKIRVPVIVLLDIQGYKHFVVVRKTVGDHVYVGDPALGNRQMDKADFVDSWNGIVFAVVGPGLEIDSVLAHPSKPVSARRLFSVHAMMPGANTLDFGIIHANYF